jgi:hypothetical protein
MSNGRKRNRVLSVSQLPDETPFTKPSMRLAATAGSRPELLAKPVVAIGQKIALIL